MPHLVEMHKKLVSQGLAVITLSLDPPGDKQMVQDANAFLQKENIPFRNLLLDESEEFWPKKFEFTLPPCYYVFDRQGRWVRLRVQDFKTPEALREELDKVIVRLLKEK